ncbi:uncharacterized protein METZ01_LOCUS273380, partial [marine metagenome]
YRRGGSCFEGRCIYPGSGYRDQVYRIEFHGAPSVPHPRFLAFVSLHGSGIHGAGGGKPSSGCPLHQPRTTGAVGGVDRQHLRLLSDIQRHVLGGLGEAFPSEVPAIGGGVRRGRCGLWHIDQRVFAHGVDCRRHRGDGGGGTTSVGEAGVGRLLWPGASGGYTWLYHVGADRRAGGRPGVGRVPVRRDQLLSAGVIGVHRFGSFSRCTSLVRHSAETVGADSGASHGL